MEGVKILLIDNNEQDNLSIYLREKLVVDGGYYITFESNKQTAIEKIRENGFDLVIVRINPSEYASLIKELKIIDPDCCIIVFVENEDPELLKEVNKLGIYDSITDPINVDKLSFLIKKGKDLHSLMLSHRKFTQSLHEHNVSLEKQNALLANRIENSTKNLTKLYEDLRSTYLRTIKALAQAIDARDHYTHSHSESVSRYAVAIAEELHLSVSDIELIREACELHDLGKIGIHDNILTKDTELNSEEWEEMKRHPITGAQILEPLTFLSNIIGLIRQHHEHYDGSGYPEGKVGEEILFGARIIHLADAYEAMRSARSYRKVPLLKLEAIAEIKKNSGTQFDPKIVRAFLKIVDKLDPG
jgi:putative nucleotidyltransferase with HDIG domain